MRHGKRQTGMVSMSVHLRYVQWEGPRHPGIGVDREAPPRDMALREPRDSVFWAATCQASRSGCKGESNMAIGSRAAYCC